MKGKRLHVMGGHVVVTHERRNDARLERYAFEIRKPVCLEDDPDVPGETCGYPLPCPHHPESKGEEPCDD